MGLRILSAVEAVGVHVQLHLLLFLAALVLQLPASSVVFGPLPSRGLLGRRALHLAFVPEFAAAQVLVGEAPRRPVGVLTVQVFAEVHIHGVWFDVGI
jgi:hypothetical protein